ncbi:hypothetical protein FRC04_008716 [Tulasnella sp. 424]|nr:hypothetical protein FRC04_008716 [Tulasnella sp. 424]KAG8979949.1 hypothetical protein FRC05_007392 [Tulasnella sp. 425]
MAKQQGEETGRRSSSAPQSAPRLKRQRSVSSHGGSNKKMSLSPAQTVQPSKPATIEKSARCIVERIKGTKHPTLNGLFTRTFEIGPDGTHYLYIFGGAREVSIHHAEITNDFYRLNMNTLEWTDISGELRECLDAGSPYRRRLLSHSLPPRENPSSALYHCDGRAFFHIFGGTDKLTTNPTNDLFVVDLYRLTWERVITLNEDGKPALDLLPRSGAGSIIVDHKLFVFGGWTRANDERYTVGRNVNSFSVLDLHSRVWIVKDRPYPPEVETLGYNISVFAPKAYKGWKLVLMRNKVEDDRPIKFEGNYMWLFNTRTYAFTRQENGGDLPPPHSWADVCPHRESEKTCVLYGSINEPDPVSGELPSDLWTFDTVTDQWKCEGFKQELWDLDCDLQTLEHVPGKGWCLLGYKQPESNRKKKKTAPESDFNRTWNVCVTLSLENA